MIKILLGGSPCTHWSVAQKNNRETEPEGLGWELFKNYLIAKEKFKPDYFLYENNKSAAQPIKDQISKELGVDLQYINSALVSAQKRERFYAHNLGVVYQPYDRHVYLSDVLDDNDLINYNGGEFRRLKPDLDSNYDSTWQIGKTGEGSGQALRVYDIKGKSVTLKANGGGGGAKTGLYRINGKVYSLNAKAAEKLQTMPAGYTKSVPYSVGLTCLGNGWTAEVIIHLLDHIQVPKDEELIVLSMYDGIGTGRYCLDKLGYKNITYYAYEIEDNAIKVAMDNYPDIIQCGDAFQVREDNWRLPI